MNTKLLMPYREDWKNRAFVMFLHNKAGLDNNAKIMKSWMNNERIFDFADYICEEFGIPVSDVFEVDSLAKLKSLLMKVISYDSINHIGHEFKMNILGRKFGCPGYVLDNLIGLCEDGDCNCIRYVNKNHNNKVYKMRASKLFRKIIDGTTSSLSIPEPVKIWLCEEFQQDWFSYASNIICDEYTLVVDNDFEFIYNSDNYANKINSCMQDKCFYDFYNNCVKARAASILNSEGLIVCRAVIYDEVHDEFGNIHRMCERQYSINDDNYLKNLLVNKLIAANEIDCYKKIGAGCSDTHAIMYVRSNDIMDDLLWISCDLNFDQCYSYQDTFKFYDKTNHKAYNDTCACFDFELTETDGELLREWDEYHERYCEETVVCYVNGCEMYVDADDLVDFVEVDGELHHMKDCYECEYCHHYVLIDDSVYSELTDELYCCERCMNNAEYDYKERNNWHYSDFDDDFCEDEEELENYIDDDQGVIYTVFKKTIEKNSGFYFNEEDEMYHYKY